MTRRLVPVFLALPLLATPARADIVFNLQGVRFTNGATLTGSFTTDDAILTLVAYDLTASAGGTFTAFEYNPGNAYAATVSPSVIEIDSNAGDRGLILSFDRTLNSAGADVKTNGGSLEFGPASRTSRNITAGRVVNAASVPEPSSLALAGVAVLGLPFLARRLRAVTPSFDSVASVSRHAP